MATPRARRAPRTPVYRPAAPRPAPAGAVRPPPPENWVTAKDAASRSSVHIATVYRWCERGEVVYRRVGGTVRIRLATDGFPLPTPAASP